MNNPTLHKQQGLTLISWAIILAFLVFQGIMAIRVVPVYMTDSSVKSIIKGLENDMSVRGQSAKKLREVIMKRMKINNIYDMEEESISIKKQKGGYRVILEYEPRGTLVGNLEYIISFRHEATVLSR